MSIEFIWDPGKNNTNIKKYGISFDEAKSVFHDDNARVIYDSDSSDNEDRFIILGLSVKFNVLVVVHCFIEKDSIIRLISARKATKNESKQYWEFIK